MEDIQGIGNFRPGVLSFPSFTIINFFRLHMRLLHNNLLSGHFAGYVFRSRKLTRFLESKRKRSRWQRRPKQTLLTGPTTALPTEDMKRITHRAKQFDAMSKRRYTQPLLDYGGYGRGLCGIPGGSQLGQASALYYTPFSNGALSSHFSSD